MKKATILPVIALAAVSFAGAQTVRNLVVTDLKGKTTQFPADQIAAVTFEETVEYLPLNRFLTAAYEESGAESGQYVIELGTGDPDSSGDPAEIGDMQVALLMRGPRSESLLEPKLPEGYYRAGNNTENFTFDITRSALWVRADEGSDGVSALMILDGTADVRAEANGLYDIRLEFVTLAGPLELRYQGELPFPPGVSEFDVFTEPVEVTFTNAQGRFYGNWYYPFAADLTTQFYVGTVTDGTLTDGYILELPIFEPKPEDCMAPDQRIADGTYTVETREQISNTYLPYRFTPGAYKDFLGHQYISGSHLTYLSPTGHRRLGFITGGTMTVSGNGTSFVFDLVTAEGVGVKGTYSGTPSIGNYCDNDVKEPKRPYSTLDGNVSLNWDPATVAISYNEGHSILDDANTIMLMFTDPAQEKGDYISLDLFTEGETVPDGTFTIDSMLAAGHAIPGAIDFAGQMMFSWYGDLGLVDDEGYNTKLGPIASGTVTISTLGDGSRKFIFNLKDDRGNEITGEYAGVLIDGNQEASMQKKLAKGTERKIRRTPVRLREQRISEKLK